MKILVTGTSSGIGAELVQQLNKMSTHIVVPVTRDHLDLSNIDAVQQYELPVIDMLINCAGTDCGGKIEFINQAQASISTILTTNLLSPVLLSHKALVLNSECKIVNITSTNNKQYWPNNLAYSLSKKALGEFGNMLQVDHPAVKYLEIRLGLTKTRFNQNRYVGYEDRFTDVYCNAHLTTGVAVDRIVSALFDNTIKFIEVAH